MLLWLYLDMDPLTQRVAARWLQAGYYRPSSSMGIDEILQRWVEQGDKVYDDAMPLYFTAAQLWPHREFTWKRDNARGGYAKVRGKSVYLDGPLKWDALGEDLKMRGWDPDDPLKLQLGKNGKSKVGEGNHRLAIAREVRLRRIPVFISFGQTVRKDTSAPMAVEYIEPKALQKAVQKRKQERPSNPASDAEVDDLMALLGL